jgi:hypothetical protein
MPEAAVIGEFERRLAELGCPEALARRKSRELAEHHADLREAALEEGFSEAAAEARADEQLGEGASLAEGLVQILRQSSWWGRHPIIGFCALPIIGFAPLWVLCGSALVGLVWLLGHLSGPAYLLNMDTVRALAQEPSEFRSYARPLVFWLNISASTLLAGLFCWLAGRAVRGLKWMMTACAVCSIGAAFSFVHLAPLRGQEYSFSLSMGYSIHPNWICAFIPWLLAALAFFQHQRRLRRLPALPLRNRFRDPRLSAWPSRPARAWLKTCLLTPTYWIVAILLALVTVGLLAAHDQNFWERAARAERAHQQATK